MFKKLLALGALLPTLAGAVEPSTGTEERAVIDLAIALDTSNSMDGLIDSAKVKLWDIVSLLASAKPTPRLRVALYSYGNDGYPERGGWVRKESDFTEDLDLIYEKLNSLRTNGGTEYVARVVREATQKLEWTPGDQALKLIFVAGNEAADQDPQYNAVTIAKQAIAKGIVVNTIYCGSPEDGDAPGYRNVAVAADGEFSSIDQNNGTVVVSTPMDTRLSQLSSELNTTYIGYGRQAEESMARQATQDANAEKAAPGTSASRAVAKGGKLYRNTSWDLVDASLEPGFDLAKVPESDLPEEMRSMTLEQRQAHIQKQLERRKEIQAEIAKLSTERQAFIAEEMKKQNLDDGKALDKVMKETLRKEASKKNIEIAE